MDTEHSKNKSLPRKTDWYNPCAGIIRWDSLDSSIFALTVIWAGLVFLSANLNLEVDAWALFFLGAGILVLFEVAIRLLNRSYHTPIIGDLIWAGVLFWLGDWTFILPVALVAIGVYMFYHFYFHNRIKFDSK
jgi:hypothetical protein